MKKMTIGYSGQPDYSGQPGYFLKKISYDKFKTHKFDCNNMVCLDCGLFLFGIIYYDYRNIVDYSMNEDMFVIENLSCDEMNIKSIIE